jgi:ribonucleoside-diphosphate reductase alpha chain
MSTSVSTISSKQNEPSISQPGLRRPTVDDDDAISPIDSYCKVASTDATVEITTEDVPLIINGREINVRLINNLSNTYPFDLFEYEQRNCVVSNSKGEVISEIKDVEVPKHWSLSATNIFISKYFRKAGIDTRIIKEGKEVSICQAIYRLARTFADKGHEYGHFPDCEAAYVRLVKSMISQKTVPASPQWFSTGLHHVYGITGPTQGRSYVDEFAEVPALVRCVDSYSHPQVHACFINGIVDDLVNDSGIMHNVTTQATIFKGGSGSGENYSALRGKGEKLTGGGTSSGVISWMKIGDATAGAIKSGGITRRAAKMVILNDDHPDIEEFVTWKQYEEAKAKALIAMGYDSHFEGEAYATVSGQNANNSVRLSDKFMHAKETDGNWDLIRRTDGTVHKTIKARALWDLIVKAAWDCADPGLQFDTTINNMNTCANSGRINASNPCSEYMHLNNTGCNLSSHNTEKFMDHETGVFDHQGWIEENDLWTRVLDITVSMASYPSDAIAWGSYNYRTLGLGYANIGTSLMCMGLAYDSDEGRENAAFITALMGGAASLCSANMARDIGTFPKFKENREPCLKVLQTHVESAYKINKALLHPSLLPYYDAMIHSWTSAYETAKMYGMRNAQLTLLAPTGTIGFIMDCDTTGIEPDFALIKYKTMAGGGYVKIVNQAVGPALRALKYSETNIADIVEYLNKWGNIETCPLLDPKHVSLFDTATANGKLQTAASVVLEPLGYTYSQIKNICDYFTTNGVLSECKDIKVDDYKTFLSCLPHVGGERFIAPVGHVKMMAAVQPFLSGAISKTVNMPESSTLEDVSEIYTLAWKLGVKAVALYRDNCKGSQVLSTSKADTSVAAPQIVEKIVEKVIVKEVRARRKLPAIRNGKTISADIDGQSVFIHTGEYEDGTLGEVFIDTYKQGSPFKGLLDLLAISVSYGLQHGVPLQMYIDKFTLTQFEPAGHVKHPFIKKCTSIPDYVFRELGRIYLNDYNLVHIKPQGVDSDDEDHYNEHLSAYQHADIHHRAESDTLPPVTRPLVMRSKPSHKGPLCKFCGFETVMSGTCHKCLNCGQTNGC